MSKFKKGDPKLPNSGRKRGQPNKSTQAYRESLASLGFDPAAEAVKLFMDDNTPIDIRLKLLQLITEHSTFKPKPPVEESTPTPTEDNLPEDTDSLLSIINTPKT